MSTFTHLHVHTEYSLLDGACRLGPLIARAKELGQTSLAVTDHGVMYGVVDFYKECKKQGIKPIIGCEVYVAPRTRFDKQHRIDNSPYHLILLCKDETGYQNLIKLVSHGFIEGFYSKPRIDRDLLEKHHEGLICLSACLAGEVPRSLMAREYERAKEAALWYRDLFGEGNYYIEIQNHGIQEQIEILPLLDKLSRETGIPMAATNDCHYVMKEDARMQNVLVCIATNRTVLEGSDMEFATEEFYLKSEEEMRALFGKFEGAVENTARIAERCNFDFVFGQTKLPFFTAPGGEDNVAFIRRMCYEGLHKYYGENPAPEAVERLEYELSVITSMGYVDYYLIVWDYIHFAKNNGIPVGPGRGSGTGSIVAYCIGITGIDPLQYNLIFERFLNPERVSMPDFDVDFCYVRRQEVIDYVVAKYGSDHVAQITTFGTMAARAALRDVGRALGMSYAAVDVIAKAVPFELGMTLDKALEVSPDFKRLYEADTQNRELVDMARKVEGMARHAGTHAAGVVITRDPADTYVPLQKSDSGVATQFTMTVLEELGLLKMDFLGLRNLTVIRDAENMLSKGKAESERFHIEDIPLDDPGVFEMLSRGQTNGVFQFESSGMKNVMIQLRPEHIGDLIAINALYRPGPMDSIPRYIQGRHNQESIRYKHPILRNALADTYGCMVYQEQVMQICREMAGYSYGRADIVRRAMSKKKHDVMLKERDSFVAGSVANGVDEKTANEIFDEMIAFASYAFPKGHAAAYATIAYQTAYLKHHHPREYMAALLTSILDNTDKVIDYIAEAKKLGIAVLPPDVGESDMGFTVVEGGIRFGLLAVKNLGRGFIAAILKEREERPFRSLLDFLERMYGKEMNKRAVEALIKCGAMDSFGHARNQMLLGYEGLLDGVETAHRGNVEGQLDLFGGADGGNASDYALPDAEEAPLMKLLADEKETTGLYLSGHPLEQHGDLVEKIKPYAVGRVLQSENLDGQTVDVVGIVSSKRLRTTKNNDMMAFIFIEDQTASIELIVFPRAFTEYSQILNVGQAVAVRGKVKSAEEESAQIVVDQIATLEDAAKDGFRADSAYPRGGNGFRSAPDESYSPEREEAAPARAPSSKKQGLYLRFPGEGSELVEKASNVLFVFEGGVPVYFYYIDTGKYVRTPRSYWTAPNDVMLGELRRLLGGENVALLG